MAVAQKSPVNFWLNELKAAQKREKDFRKDGQRIIDIYDGTKAKQTPFNILFANTETLFPALYSTLPRPVVERRFKDDDAIGKAGAAAGKRVLEFLLDTNIEGYETFDLGMKNAVLDALLPGRGVTAVKYDADVEDIVEKGAEGKEEIIPYKKSELACVDSRPWNRVFFGYAKKWSKVPWVAYEEHIDREEATRLFGIEIASQLVYSEAEDKDDEDKKAAEDQGERRTCCIYQIWDKETRKVRYISEQYKDGYLKEENDPLQLTGFFNCPRPMQFIEKSSDLLPVALYTVYEQQAKELNRLQQRINRIVEAIKARGVYDGDLGDDLSRIMDADDNMLIPADKASSLASEKGLQNAIWFMPLEQLVVTLQQLYAARESCKQVIYEITGIADIMRGQSQASETLGAQQIKQSWGNLRLKRLQKEVQRYARDLLRLMLEIAATKFSEDTWARMTSLPYLTEAKAQELQGVSQGLQQQLQLADPAQQQQLQQQMQEVQQQLQTPKWADVLAMLKDDVQRAYRIDIETNSTVEPEAVEDQEHITQLMNSIGQYLNGIGPLVANGVMPFDAARAMLLAIVRRYRFGSEIEDQITAMQPPQQKDDGSQAKLQMEQEKHQAEMASKQADAQAKQQENAQKAQLAERQHQLDMERMSREAEYQAAEHRMKMAELSAKVQIDQIVAASKIKVAQATAAAKERQVMQPSA